MKKLITIFILLITLVSCDGIDSKDNIISTVLKLETEHLMRYNKIQKLSKDTLVLNYINKLKDSLKLNASQTKGLLEGKSGIMFGSLSNSKEKLDNYIKLCEN